MASSGGMVFTQQQNHQPPNKLIMHQGCPIYIPRKLGDHLSWKPLLVGLWFGIGFCSLFKTKRTKKGPKSPAIGDLPGHFPLLLKCVMLFFILDFHTNFISTNVICFRWLTLFVFSLVTFLIGHLKHVISTSVKLVWKFGAKSSITHLKFVRRCEGASVGARIHCPSRRLIDYTYDFKCPSSLGKGLLKILEYSRGVNSKPVPDYWPKLGTNNRESTQEPSGVSGY
jgi:hypothetical protein